MTELRKLKLQGIISTNNSSTALLGIAGVFTGQWVDILDYGTVFISVFADQDGEIVIEQSTDGINADYNDTYTIFASNGKNYAVNPHAQYLRVRYTNGLVAQSAFRLQTILKGISVPSSHKINDDITGEDDSTLNSTVLKVQTNDNFTYKNVDVQNPLPTDGTSVYAKDLDLDNSTSVGWTGVNSGNTIEDLFKEISDGVTNTTATNPKQILLRFRRSVVSAGQMGIGTATGSFSNMKVTALYSATTNVVIYDGSSDATLRTTVILEFSPIGFVGLLIEFYTANTITLTNIYIPVARAVVARLQAQKDDDTITNIGATNNSNLRVSIQEYGDTSSIDAFTRLRISSPFTIFDSKQLYDKQPLFWDESLGGSATSTHSTTHARTQMAVTASASDYAIRQTKQRFNYQPGKSQLILFTFFADQQDGVTQRMGLFDGTGGTFMTPNNGVFLETENASVSWNIAKAGSTTETVAQASWSIDTLDGTGVSGVTLDLDATQIGIIDFEWLGVGRVRVGFVIDGLIYYCHEFNHANDSTYSTVYMSTPNLPMRYDIQSDGTTAGYLDHICGTVMSEGGVELTGISRSIDTNNTHLDANTADTPYVLLALRLKTTHLDLTVLPQTLSMISETNDDFRWSLLLNPTYNGTLTYTDITNSGCQRAAGATANDITAVGTQLASGYSKSAGSIDSNIVNNLRIGSQIDGTRDELILAVTPLSSNADIQGAIIFRELL